MPLIATRVHPYAFYVLEPLVLGRPFEALQ